MASQTKLLKNLTIELIMQETGMSRKRARMAVEELQATDTIRFTPQGTLAIRADRKVI